jgi:polyisoprenoid-binding protein YceI
MRILSGLLTAAAAFTLMTGAAQAEQYVLDTAHTSVGFQVRHMASKVQGSFNEFQGSFSFDPAKPEKASGTIEINAASIDTNNNKRDDHLRSPDFFEVQKHPKLTYVIKGAKKEGKDFVLDGELTMRGVTKKVPLKVEYLGEGKNPWGQKVLSYAGTAKVNRKDFGLNWNKALEAGGFLVGDDVEITINAEANPKQAEQK